MKYEYVVLENRDKDMLIATVNDHYLSGWLIQGGISVFVSIAAIRYYQSMMKPIQESSHQRSMEHSDFHVGLHFFTATGEWVCADIGIKILTAFKVGEDERDSILFDKYDFGGCRLTPF
jgi:hypothetical protein